MSAQSQNKRLLCALAMGALALAAAIALTGCVITSVYPFFTSKDVTFEPALVGTWVNAAPDAKSDEQWKFERGEIGSYKLAVHELAKEQVFTVHLFQIKGRRFLDVLPTERKDDFIPPHYLLKVIRLEPALEVEMMDYDWLKKLVVQDPESIRHVLVDGTPGEPGSGRIVLTAGTAELQEFILRHVDSKKAFHDPVVLKRR